MAAKQQGINPEIIMLFLFPIITLSLFVAGIFIYNVVLPLLR